MYCKFIKLTNGDDIIARTDDNCEDFYKKDFISVIDPVLIGTMRIPRGSVVIEAFTMRPWLKMATADAVQVPTKNIIVVVDVQENASQQYLAFIEENNKKTDNETFVELEDADDDDLTVEEFLEMLGSETDDEEEDEYGRTRSKSSRTLH